MLNIPNTSLYKNNIVLTKKKRKKKKPVDYIITGTLLHNNRNIAHSTPFVPRFSSVIILKFNVEWGEFVMKEEL